MDAGQNKLLVKQLKKSQVLLARAVAARDSVRYGDMSDDGHKRGWYITRGALRSMAACRLVPRRGRNGADHARGE